MKPIQYQRGWVEFYKLKFKVTPDVLIPRPETELLVENVLRFVTDCHVGPESPQDSLPRNDIIILDIGTGAGNIAISLAKSLCGNLEGCNVKIIATDVPKKALVVAKQNAKSHGVEDKIEFIHSNLLSNVILAKAGIYRDKKTPGSRIKSRMTTKEDDKLVIVTNLPYIPTERIPYLDASVKDYEPHIALDGGEDGFELYRKLFQQIKEKNLKPKLVIGEIDYTHREIAANEARKYFPEAQVEVKTDLAHKQRILQISF